MPKATSLILPTRLQYDIKISIDTAGNVNYKISRPVETLEFVQHLQSIAHAQLNYFIAERLKMMQAKNLLPHEFSGDDNGICTVCGKPQNAHA